MKRIIMGIIRFYQKYISSLKAVPSCRFYPTCSQYALEAVERFGVCKGSFLAIKRILKCHPYHKGGVDPVPQAKEKKK